jgi:hypothetical protein
MEVGKRDVIWHKFINPFNNEHIMTSSSSFL